MFEALLKGWIGELKTKATQKLFLDSRQYHVCNGVFVKGKQGTTQIDHIIVSKYGVFVVETKQRSGWIFGRKNDNQWTQKTFGKTVRFQNPLRQNYLHTESLAECLQIHRNKIHSLIVFWGDSEFKTPLPKNVVKGILEPTNYIKSKKRILLTDEEVNRVCAQVQAIKDNTSILQGIRHAYFVHKKHHNASICPRCGGKLLPRTSTRGRSPGYRFLGCENYPRCRYMKHPK